ncbi:tRNA uridine-5-carboxymethylaminomethyl(34) synthesis GTPase MnmE, partial [Planctomycetota bacterium]
AELVTSGLAPGGAHHAVLSARQRQMILQARASMERGIESCGRGLDLAASDIRDALTFFGSVLGWGATEEILDAVFRDFCVGK